MGSSHQTWNCAVEYRFRCKESMNPGVREIFGILAHNLPKWPPTAKPRDSCSGICIPLHKWGLDSWASFYVLLLGICCFWVSFSTFYPKSTSLLGDEKAIKSSRGKHITTLCWIFVKKPHHSAILCKTNRMMPLESKTTSSRIRSVWKQNRITQKTLENKTTALRKLWKKNRITQKTLENKTASLRKLWKKNRITQKTLENKTASLRKLWKTKPHHSENFGKQNRITQKTLENKTASLRKFWKTKPHHSENFGKQNRITQTQKTLENKTASLRKLWEKTNSITQKKLGTQLLLFRYSHPRAIFQVVLDSMSNNGDAT